MRKLFKSKSEKRLWTWVLIIVLAIFSTLFLGQPLAQLFSNQDLQAAIFLVAMAVIGVVILLHGLKVKPRKKELIIWLGIIAVYLMFFLRLGLAERSHLIEYSVLAIFIHKALLARNKNDAKIKYPALLAFIIVFLIGCFDECLQIFIPSRVFDPVDIFFNGFVSAAALFSHWGIQKLRLFRNKN
ncbi:MAG: VanZ family protein [Saprospiraceae bacterium]|nr:VanZ family protein [Bacteroidia bacterium]NNE13529.1 VanZ family protein [Saprospiraceae bacterium]NNL93620.1 VanZ family protein [Saprospiraceae bacterium]